MKLKYKIIDNGIGRVRKQEATPFMNYRTARCISTVAALLATGLSLYGQASDVKNEAEKIAAELANPLSPVTTLTAQFRAEIENGPDDDVNYTLRMQPSLFKPYANRSAFLLRTIFPWLSRNWPTSDSGLGDVSLIPYFVPDTTKATFLGYGAVLGFPTASEDSLGGGKWSTGPALILARTGMPITYGSLFQHVWSYAGDADRSEISASTIQPFLTYLMGGGWAASANSEVLYNWQADDDEWTVPLALVVTKVVNIGGKFVNLGLAGIEYVEKPDYMQDWEVRVAATYVLR